MNMRIARLVALLSCLVAPYSYGGSKGFTAVFMDIGGEKFFESKTYQAFSNGFPNSPQRERCWEGHATGGKSFELIIKKKIPNDLTKEMIQAVWAGDLKSTKTVQQILSRATPLDDNEIDGIYIINAKDGSISIMALGSRGSIGSKNPSQKIHIPWHENDPRQSAAAFDLALCSASGPLDIGFSP